MLHRTKSQHASPYGNHLLYIWAKIPRWAPYIGKKHTHGAQMGGRENRTNIIICCNVHA